MAEIGWRVLPLGCGGLVTGFDIADDGTKVCRTDVGNCYVFRGDITDPNNRWQALFTPTSLPAGGSVRLRGTPGGWELAIAPSNSDVMYCVYPDDDSSVTTAAKYWVYRTLNGGATWNKTSVTTLNADSNGTDSSKNASGKIIIDPINPDIVYCGLPLSSGDSFAVYRSTDGGANFSHVESWATATVPPGVAGMAFDRSSGTISVGGQLRTARVLIPVGGQGIFESTDGGQTWTDTTPNGIGTVNVAGYQGRFTNTGIYYGLLSTGTMSGVNVVSRGYLWRYKAGVWEQLDGASSTFTGTKVTMVTATFNATFNGTAMTVNSVSSGTIANGNRVYVGNVNKGTINGGSHPNWTLNTINAVSTDDAAALNATAGYASYGTPMIDQRPGQDGYLTTAGPNGNGVGYTSTNADQALGSITWGGATGGHVVNLSIDSYEPGWFSDLPHGSSSVFLGGTAVIIDSSGTAWWSGHQAFWHYTSRPDFSTAPGRTTTSVSTGRGMECTISQDVCMPQGAPYPVMCTQDIGIERGTFTTYPASGYPSGGRPQGYNIEFSASDNSFVVAKIDKFGSDGATILSNNAGLSSYSENYGAMGSWVPYGVMPDGYYQAVFTADIQNGIGGNSGSTMTVTSVTAPGNVLQGQSITLGSVGTGASRGIVISQLSGTPGQAGTYDVGVQSRNFNATISNGSGASGDILNVTSIISGSTSIAVGQRLYGQVLVNGGTETAWTFLGEIIALIGGTGNTGTYQLSQSSFQSSRALYLYTPTTATTSQTMNGTINTQGGQIVAVTPDIHVLFPYGFNPVQGFPVIRTTNARAATPSWSFVSGLQSLPWARRTFNSGNGAKPMTAGYGSQVGTLWIVYAAAQATADVSTIYKSTDNGATWTVASNLQIGGGGNFTVAYLYAVPGYPDHLWLSCLFTGGSQPMKLWRSVDGGANWVQAKMPTTTGTPIPRLLCLGAPQTPGGYPTVYFQVWFSATAGAAPAKLFYSTNGDVADVANNLTWNVFGSTGTIADMTGPGSITQIQSIHGDWNVFKRIYAAVTNMGYAFYQVSPDAVAPLRLRLKA